MTMNKAEARKTIESLNAVGSPVERPVWRLALNCDHLSRRATRLASTFERRTEVAEDVIDAIEVLTGLRDLLAAHYLDAELAHEASQGAYMQAAWLEECANNNPEPAKRRELLRRAWAAKNAGDKLRAVS